MTPPEAIKVLRLNIFFSPQSDVFREAAELAISALEKTIPKKVKNKVCASSQIYYGKCPNCGNIVNDTVNIKICNNVKCGQVLDWSDDK